MKTTHTPGPWKAEKDAKGRWSIDAKDGSAWIARTFPMCDLKTNMALFDTEADARLIAAAPELLETLQNIANCNLSNWSEEFRNGDDFRIWAQTRALLAIAKAVGVCG